MKGRKVFGALCVLGFVGIVAILAPERARAAPYADMVMDARSGEVIHATNADSRLHPASLTKMMTLYIAFEAIRMGEISLDTPVTISGKAAAEPPSKLGLRAGQRIQLRYLIRAAAVKSANDAATAIGEAIEGSEAAFARRMNRTARALGMTRTTFKNAHGLTEDGHLSTARDMSILGRQLLYNYPQYYNLFSRRSTDAGVTNVANTNSRFLDAYPGADGIKTGYTRAAGFNLVASAERGQERIIATVFGGTSTANRNARMAELMDLGFRRAPSRVALNRPRMPQYDGLDADGEEVLLADGATGTAHGAAGKILRMSGAVTRSRRPAPRGAGSAAEPAQDMLLASIESDVAAAVAAAAAEAATAVAAEAASGAVVETVAASVAADVAGVLEETAPETPDAGAETRLALAGAMSAPPPRPDGLVARAPEAPATAEMALAMAGADAQDASQLQAADAAMDAVPGAGAPEALSLVAEVAPAPDDEPAEALAAILPADQVTAPRALAAAAAPAIAPAPAPESRLLAAAVLPPALPEPIIRPEPLSAEIVTRASASGGRHYGLSLGRYASRGAAEKALIAVSLSDMAGLGGALRRVVPRGGGFEANFMGMSEEEAGLACSRIVARGLDCATIGD